MCVCACAGGMCSRQWERCALEPPGWDELHVFEELTPDKDRGEEQRGDAGGGWRMEHMGSCGPR